MNKINNKELNERVANLTDKIGDVMEDEDVGVCWHALVNITASLLASYTDAEIATVEDSAKLFYKQLLRSIKSIEQNIENNAKAN